MKLLRTALLVTMLAAPGFAAAEDYYLVSGFISKHQRGDFRENNYGIGLERRSATHSDVVGYYRNSLDRDSFYAVRSFRYAIGQSGVSIGAAVGLVTGYRWTVTPFIAPTLEWMVHDRLGLNVIVLPPVPSVTPAVVALQVKIRF